MIAFGFWAGDERMREPTFYSYTAPEPGLRETRLLPGGARWLEQGAGSLAVLPYELVQGSSSPKRTLLAFLGSAYQAGAGLAGWDRGELQSSWCPAPPQSSDLLAVNVVS